MSPSVALTDKDEEIVSHTSVNGLSKTSAAHIKSWERHIRGGFATFPVVWESAQGHIITDIDGKQYIDLISQFAVLNFGHSHPKIVEAAVQQMRKVAVLNTSYVSPLYAKLAERLTQKFGYDSVAAMVTGSEAVDSCVKAARKWAYLKKGVPADEAWILTTDHCYHGVTLATMCLSNHIADHFGKHVANVGPFGPSSGRLIRYGHIEDLEAVLKESGHQVAAFLIEPIQGYAGTRAPPAGYLRAVQDLCKMHNVLFVCDEVQTGFGRTGTDLAYQHEPGVQPDLVALGKAVTGGIYPMSIIMGKSHVMDLLEHYDIASTYAATPVACAAALAAIDILEEEDISARAQRLGDVLTQALEDANLPHILEHRGRGRGLFQTLVVDESTEGVTARRIAALCAIRGVLCGNSANRLRFSPPLTITEADLLRAVDVIAGAFRDVATLGKFPGCDGLD